MDRMIYVAMSGAKETLLAQAVNANNLANVNTTGFRADLAQARSMPVYGEGLAARVYALTERPATDFAPGSAMATGRDLDVAIQGEGWLAVQAPDGAEAYTRAGDLRITETGLLTTGNGHLVLGNGGPISIPPVEKLEIGRDGSLSGVPSGQPATTLVSLDRLKLVSAAGVDLVKGEDGLMRSADGAPLPADAAVSVIAGSLESSNVNAVEAMVNMIALARRFEMQVKMMNVAEENDTASTRALNLG